MYFFYSCIVLNIFYMLSTSKCLCLNLIFSMNPVSYIHMSHLLTFRCLIDISKLARPKPNSGFSSLNLPLHICNFNKLFILEIDQAPNFNVIIDSASLSHVSFPYLINHQILLVLSSNYPKANHFSLI